jgi:putative membrane protein
MIAAAVSAAALLGGCMTTPAADRMSAAAAMDPMSPLSAPGYMRMAASSDLFEIESSRLALQASRNEAVRQFAQMMVGDHSRTSSDMMATARQLGLQAPPPQLLPHHMEMLDRLRAASPMDFDRAYKAEQIMAHEEALNLHRNYAQSGDTPAFRELATRAVPIVEMHWGQARNLPDYTAAPAPTYQPAPQPDTRRRAGERG